MKKIILFFGFLMIFASVMAQQQHINIGTSPNDGTGDPLRTAFEKINDNFDELFARPYVFDTSYWQLYGTNQIMPNPSTKYIRIPSLPSYIPSSPYVGKLRPVFFSLSLKTLAIKVESIGVLNDTIAISTDNCHDSYRWETESVKDTVFIDSIKNLCGEFTVVNNGTGSQLTLLSIEGLHFNTEDKVVLNYLEWVKIIPDSINSVFLTYGNSISDSANVLITKNTFKDDQTFDKGIVYTPLIVDSANIDMSGIGIDSLTRVIIYDDHANCWFVWDQQYTPPISDGAQGQIITVLSLQEGRIFLNHNLFILKDTNDFIMGCGDNITLMFVIGSGWIEIARTDRPYDCSP